MDKRMTNKRKPQIKNRSKDAIIIVPGPACSSAEAFPGTLTGTSEDKNGRIKAKQSNDQESVYSAIYSGLTFRESAEINKNLKSDKEVKERATVHYLLPIFNKQMNSNWEISDEIICQADIVDVYIINKDTNEKLGIQITESDGYAVGQRNRNKYILREGDLYLICSKAIKERVDDKSRKYPLRDKNITILALIGWAGVTVDVLDRFKNEEKAFLEATGYLQIWFVGRLNDEVFRLL